MEVDLAAMDEEGNKNTIDGSKLASKLAYEKWSTQTAGAVRRSGTFTAQLSRLFVESLSAERTTEDI